ncbi:MAG: penicillin-binding transpeptidase domain-containing protein [Dermatophilaceae bacterium]
MSPPENPRPPRSRTARPGSRTGRPSAGKPAPKDTAAGRPKPRRAPAKAAGTSKPTTPKTARSPQAPPRKPTATPKAPARKPATTRKPAATRKAPARKPTPTSVSRSSARAARPARPSRPAPSRPRPRRRPIQVNSRRRVRGILVISLFVFSLFSVQLVRVQGLDAAAVAAEALNQRNRTEVLPALRGQIVDTGGVVLAQSIETRTVTVDQTAVPEYVQRIDGVRTKVGVRGAAEALAPLLGMSEARARDALTGTARYRILAKDVGVPAWRRISALGIPGVFSERTARRDYPQSTTAASLVGWVYADGRAGGGVETMLDETLAGVSGSAKYETSPNGRIIPNGRQVVEDAVHGRKVQLTINSSIQWYAQNALAQGIRGVGGDSGTIVVQHAKTGELLAVASYPSYDPNRIGSVKGSLDNLAFSQIFEPGSTNKIVTMAAALQEGVVTPDQPVVIPNRLPRADQRFKDASDHATLFYTATGVLAKSSNIGTILIGERLEAEVLEKYFRDFGMGSMTGVDFPNESPGLVTPAAEMSGSKRYTVMYGQGMSVTTIQSSSAFQTIANGGVRVQPTLIKAVEGEEGVMIPAEPPATKRVIDTQVADDVMMMLTGAVDEGSAPQAQIPGYRIAGKTGTADRYDDRLGRYSGKTASFIGVAPADDPEIVVTVIVDKPRTQFYGGLVAAPIFKDVTTYALAEMGIPPTGAELETPVPIELDGPPSKDDPRVLGPEYIP